MSHFSVLVTGSDVERAMAPFQENNMGDCPKQYLAFNDLTDEYTTEYETGSTTRVVMPDGRLLWPWDDEFRVPGSLGLGRDTHKVPEHLEQRVIPFKELYASLDDFARDYHSSTRDETGKFGYWENPNRKWDYWRVGGRWRGSLKLKTGAGGTLAAPSWEHTFNGAEPEDKSGWVDQARARDIDWLAMIAEQAEKARDNFRKVTAAIAGLPYHTPWDVVREKLGANLDAARDEFHAQPTMQAMKQAFPETWSVSDMLDGVLAFNGDEDAYVEFMSRDRSRQYALLHEGKWYEPGEMGWFGSSSQTLESRKAYTKQYWDIVLALDPDTVVSVVDCHI